MYKLRDIYNGQFSTGGVYPGWSENGVRWATLHQVRAHILFAAKVNPDIYKQAEVVEIEEVVKRVVNSFEVFPLEVPKKKRGRPNAR